MSSKRLYVVCRAGAEITKTPESEKAIALAKALFDADGQKVTVTEEPTGIVIYSNMPAKDKFLSLSKKEQEDKLMETAMRIMDIMCDMHYAHQLNPDKLDDTSFMQKLELFTTWARDYEYGKYGTEEYETLWLENTEKVFTKKLTEEFINV